MLIVINVWAACGLVSIAAVFSLRHDETKNGCEVDNLWFERLAFLIPFLIFRKIIRSHAVTVRWLDNVKECIQSGWSEQRDCWIDHRLNATRRSIDLSVYLVFDLEAKRFKFLGENLLGAGAVENELSTLDSFSSRVVTVNAKTNQVSQFHHFESQKLCNE